MGNITLEQVLAFGGIAFGLYEMITKAKLIHEKPAKEVETKIDQKLDELKADFKNEMTAIKKENNLTLKAVYQLSLHAVTGNHIVDMEALNKEIQEHLINN